MPPQELDLIEIAAVLPAQLGAETAELVGAEAFDADITRPLTMWSVPTLIT
jgi:hypothetical protein